MVEQPGWVICCLRGFSDEARVVVGRGIGVNAIGREFIGVCDCGLVNPGYGGGGVLRKG